MKESSDVDGYIGRQAPLAQPVLRQVRAIIRKALPGAEETISYGIPTFRLHGQYVVYLAGWKQHWSLYPVMEPIRLALGSALERYQFSKGTLRFPLSEPVPAALVRRVVRALARAAEERARARARRPRARGPAEQRDPGPRRARRRGRAAARPRAARSR